MLVIMNETEKFAYIAGYFDGDACFYCRKETDKRDKRIYYRCGIQVTSTNPEIIQYLKDQFGGSFCQSNRHKTQINWKPEYCFHLQGKQAYKLAKDVLPYLVEKKDEASIICKFIETLDKTEKDNLIIQMKNIKQNSNLIKREDEINIYNFRNSISAKTIDFIYLAGFIDAECCLKITSNKTYLCCNNSKLPIFDWLMKRFGGNIYFIPRNEKHKKLRNQFQWYLSSQSLYPILLKIQDFLRFKKPVCKKLIEYQKTINRNTRTDTLRLALRKSIIQEVHNLNLKGSS